MHQLRLFQMLVGGQVVVTKELVQFSFEDALATLRLSRIFEVSCEGTVAHTDSGAASNRAMITNNARHCGAREDQTGRPCYGRSGNIPNCEFAREQ